MSPVRYQETCTDEVAPEVVRIITSRGLVDPLMGHAFTIDGPQSNHFIMTRASGSIEQTDYGEGPQPLSHRKFHLSEGETVSYVGPDHRVDLEFIPGGPASNNPASQSFIRRPNRPSRTVSDEDIEHLGL